MPHFYDVTLRDYSKELSTVQYPISPITVITIEAELVLLTALRTATEGITLGTTAKDKIIMDETIYSGSSPTDENAQRERKWLVRYHGVTSGKKYTLTVPTADLDGNLVPGTDIADLVNSEAMAAFVTAFQNGVSAPYSAGVAGVETVLVDEIVHVGRNL